MHKLILCIALTISPLYAADNNALFDARTSAMGSASVSLVAFDNPGSNSLLPESRASLHYANAYGIKELSTTAASLFYANKVLDAGLIVSRFGYEKYNETRLSGNFSKKLSKRLSAGVRFNYYSILMSAEEGAKSTLSTDAGVLMTILPDLTVGASVHNFIRTTYTTARGDFELPLLLKVGANYTFNKDFMIVGELAKSSQDDMLIKMGMEYKPLNEVALRVGLMGEPFQPTFGVGYAPGRFSFDVASVYHTVLGFHTQFSMQYKF